jgi:sigma-B regulation protein RsbU (phosphoserine phosphatase)
MIGRLKISSLFFYGLTSFMVLIIIVCLVNALSWVNKPFPGFFLYDFPYVGTFSAEDWSGRKAGLKVLDRIVSIEDQPVWQGKDVLRVVSKQKPGTPLKYVIESKGKLRELNLLVGTFSVKDFFLVFLVTYLGGIAVFCLGFIVYLLKPNVSTSWVFFLLCFFLSLYMITGFEILTNYLFVEIHYLALCIMSPFFFHLGSIFPERKRFLNRYPKLEYIIYAPAVILALYYQIYIFGFTDILSSNALTWLPSYTNMASINRIFTLFCVLSLIIFVLHSVFRASTIIARQRSRMILFGVTIAFAPCVVIMLAAALFRFSFPWNFLVYFVIFFPASIAYSIVRHNLFDADEIIKRTVGYFVVTAIVVGAYIVVSLILNMFMGKYQVAQSRSFPILFTLGVILVFNPLRDRIQALVDRVFFRKEYDYGAIVEKVGGAMTSLLELSQILKRLTQTFMEDMFINTSSVMLLTPEGEEYRVFMADGEKKEIVEKKTLKRNDPLMEILEGEKKELTKYDVLEDPKFSGVSESCADNFEALHASLIVPLVYQNQVIGSLNLGEKKSGKFYNREDVELFRTLAHQGAVAIENARLFQENLEKQRMEEELNIARDLQMSMLPATCPEVEGFKIAANATPAREVGGDFYDFIEIGEEKAGMVIGDVTGKSVSGALVMSASRSVFRMLSEEELSVSESMMRANRRLKKDVKSGMFVALLFAVLNSKNRTLALCSAGQTQPIHISAKTGEAKLIETIGDTFPLGILDDVEYQETQIQLAPGDKVIFYTDGIVEAMNEKEEIFGFNRLLEVAHNARSMDAESLLTEILGKVDEFAGNAAQHDDITIIVVSVET